MNDSRRYMEPVNHGRSYSWIAWVLIGVTIGLAPGVVKISQMKNEVKTTTESTAKEIADLQGKLKALVDQDMMSEQHAIDREKYHTLLISNFGPVPHREIVGVEDPWSHIDVGYTAGTIWVIPGLVQPHTLNPDQRASWAVVTPDGHVGRWLQAPASPGIAGVSQ